MLTQTLSTLVIPHSPTVINSLANIRKEWESATEGESLVDVQSSVGLLLFDVVMALGLNRIEQEQVLGSKLRREVIRNLKPNNNNGN